MARRMKGEEAEDSDGSNTMLTLWQPTLPLNHDPSGQTCIHRSIGMTAIPGPDAAQQDKKKSSL